jgi:hypothetical protein
MANTTGRNYRKEERMQGAHRKIERAARNRARYAFLKKLTEKYGAVRARQMMAGKDVNHIKSLAQGGSNATSNLELISKKKNRSDKKLFRGKRTTRPKRHRGSER